MKTRLLTIVVAAALATGVGLVVTVPSAAQVGPIASGAFPLPVPIPASAVNGAGAILIGTGGASATVGGTLFVSTTAASTTGTVEETLVSYTMPANTLAVNGRGVRITAWGTTAANANSKTIKIVFGVSGPLVLTTTGSNIGWRGTVYMTRTGASAQTTWGESLASGTAGAYGAFTATEALTSAVLIKVTGTTPTASGDVTLTGFLVEAI